MEFPRLPTPPPPRTRPPTTSPTEARRGTAKRLDDITGKVHSIQGFIEIIGSGEAILDVNFPVWFLEKPHFTFGGEMAPGQVLVVGEYPTISITVHGWIMKDYPGNVSYFAGAHLIIVTTGPVEQRMIGHWQAQAKALRNPSGETITADGVI